VVQPTAITRRDVWSGAIDHIVEAATISISSTRKGWRIATLVPCPGCSANISSPAA
jgi:hypothetical protein